MQFSATKEEAAQHFVLAQGDSERNSKLVSLIGSLWNAHSCDVVRCAECDLVFAVPFVAGNAEFYNLAYPHIDYPRSKWEYAVTVEALERTKRQPRKVLEVGSGFGYFLEKICPRFFPHDEIVATEYNADARAELTRKGYEAVDGDIRNPQFSRFAGTFGAIFMFQVLEHMDDLDELLAQLSFLSAERSDLFIAVPNPAGIAFGEKHGALLDMPPNHISRWSEKSFGALAAKARFDIVDILYEPLTTMEFIKQDIVSSYMRRSQQPDSLANRVRSGRRSRLRKITEIMLAVSAAPLRIPVWLEVARSYDALPGGSMWVHLRRGSTS